ncbi:MAG TPA: glycosyltransferase family 9 protein [Verrucomicrobiae bacterium]|nr:glycosyltransferase family 9 protein [Verrucomicrobiae bacterium]
MDIRDNILLIRLKSIGDVLFTLPAVHAVRENFPLARLHFLVSAENAPLLRGFAEIDAVLPLDRAVYRSGNLKSAISGTFELLRVLRQKKFSLAIDFQGYGETELLSWWSGAPARWGCVYNRSRGWLYTRGVRRNHRLHLVDWNLALVEQCGLRIGRIRNEFDLPEDALAEARRFFAARGFDAARPTLFLQPFTSSPHKNWPLENFLALARHWQARGWQVMFGGGPSDRAALEPARVEGFPVAAGMPLLVSAGLVKLSTLTVGGVTGLMHLAVAMQKRVLMLIGYPTHEPGFPYQHRDWAVTPTDGGSVSKIRTDVVIAACARTFAEMGAVPGGS